METAKYCSRRQEAAHISTRKLSGGDDGKQRSKKLVPHGECHYCGGCDHFIRNCKELAMDIKKRKDSRKERVSINVVDNFEGDDSGEEDNFKLEGEIVANLSELNLTDHDSDWYIDSGATKHVTGSKNLLKNLDMGSSSKVSTAGGEKLSVAGKGVVEVPT